MLQHNQLLFDHYRNAPFLVIITIGYIPDYSESERSLLLKVINFSIRLENLNHADYLVSFELFYRDIRSLEVLSAKDLDFIKTKTKDIALSLFITAACVKICHKENLML